MMVIFLVGLVSMILMRTLRKDYARYSKEEEMDDMVRWRQLSAFLLSPLFVKLRCLYTDISTEAGGHRWRGLFPETCSSGSLIETHGHLLVSTHLFAKLVNRMTRGDVWSYWKLALNFLCSFFLEGDFHKVFIVHVFFLFFSSCSAVPFFKMLQEFLKTVCQSVFSMESFSIRTETLGMNTAGSRYTEMCFGRQVTRWYFPRSLAPAARSSPFL